VPSGGGIGALAALLSHEAEAEVPVGSEVALDDIQNAFGPPPHDCYLNTNECAQFLPRTATLKIRRREDALCDSK
jgi:hypothetical protein